MSAPLASWPSWSDDILGVVVVVVGVSTTLFVAVHMFMHLWCLYGIAQIGLNEGREGAVQTFNQGEGKLRVFLCVVVGALYAGFVSFFLGTVLLIMAHKDFAPEFMRTDWEPIPRDTLRTVIVAFFFIYAAPAVISTVTTAIAFSHDRIKLRRLDRVKREADDARRAGAAAEEAGFSHAAVPEGQQSYAWDKDVIILVPTYQEPLANLLSTINAITESEYPLDKVHVLVGFDDDSDKTLTAMFTIERILNGDVVQGFGGNDESALRVSAPGSALSGIGSDLGNSSDLSSTTLPSYDDLPSALGRNKYNGLLKIAHQSRSSVDVRGTSSTVSGATSPLSAGSMVSFRSHADRDPSPRAIDIHYRNVQFTIARYEHGGKLHTQAKMFALVEERVRAGVYPPDALLLFVDSDTTLVPSTVRKFVDHFAVHQQRACATGFIVSRNGHANSWLQKMQDAEYIFMQVSMRYVEATFGSVTCLPGALTMIKYATMHELAKIYFHQPDVDSTFEFCRRKLGEDRFLTHLAMEYLGPYSIGFVPDAVSKTEAPNLFYDLLRQRRRWLLGSLTNELYMVTTPSFFVKYPALVIFRIMTVMRLGGSTFYLALIECILLAIKRPDQVTPLDVFVLVFSPLLFWLILTGWAVWQRRIKSLGFFFAYLLTNQVMEIFYYGYTLWTLRERTWGGPRAVGEAETVEIVAEKPGDGKVGGIASYSMPYTPPKGGAPIPAPARTASRMTMVMTSGGVPVAQGSPLAQTQTQTQ
ncbi:hypothetical protein H9P43_006900 [Blastocladiella emersonii ATCC 22665]|nr:hypothetical protein H9P43_006900 [Blastocladiella emersonii ATCC 22665]